MSRTVSLASRKFSREAKLRSINNYNNTVIIKVHRANINLSYIIPVIDYMDKFDKGM